MSPNGATGEAEVGSDGPRKKGKATPDTLKYVKPPLSVTNSRFAVLQLTYPGSGA